MPEQENDLTEYRTRARWVRGNDVTLDHSSGRKIYCVHVNMENGLCKSYLAYVSRSDNRRAVNIILQY